MKIVATSDLHGSLPEIPECDLLIIAGDILPLWHGDQGLLAEYWLNTRFRHWLDDVPATFAVMIAGNHDFFIQDDFGLFQILELPIAYVQDFGFNYDGIECYGLPWVPRLEGWAFHADDEKMSMAYDAIPDKTDIVISHGPPLGVLDNGRWHFGHSAVNEMIQRVKPDLFVCGHVHEGYGHEMVGQTHVFNVSHNDIEYRPVNKCVIIDYDKASGNMDSNLIKDV